MTTVIPVHVVGGYLGAGKTTLVNQILRHAQGRRIAVLVNDFGALPIDADLIESRDGTTMAIAGGCACCSFGNDLIAALKAIALRVPRPDHLVVEASGVALPSAIAASISLLSDFACDGVVVLADAETVREHAADRYLGDTIERQLSDASLILLSKPDLVSGSTLEDTRTWLARYAPVIDCARGQVPLELLLGLATRQPDAGTLRGSAIRHPDYDSTAFDDVAPLDVTRLADALAAPGLGILRAKGRLRDLGGDWHTLNVVGARVELARASIPGGTAALVCIGLAGKLEASAVALLIESLATRRGSDQGEENSSGQDDVVDARTT